MVNLFLMGLLLTAAAVWTMRSGRKLQRTLSRRTAKAQFPELVSVVLLAVQASGLVGIVRETSIVNIAAGAFVLAILLAVRSGTEGELH